MRARWSRLVAAGAVVTATALASGCVVFQAGPTAAQLQTVGDVQLTFTACATNTTTCLNKGNSRPAPARGTYDVTPTAKLANG